MSIRRFTSILCLTLLAASAGLSQAPTPPTPPPSTPAAPPPRSARDYGMDRHNMEGPDRERPAERGPGGAMGIVPPGTWWKNPEIITALTLTADQQKKMDEIFRQNRIALIDVKASLEKEQINLEPLLNANPVDSAKAMAEISKIADLRAGLEKANAKMLLSLRSVLTAEQWTKLQDLQHSHRKGPGPDAQGPGRGKGGRGPGGQAGPPPPSN